MLLKLRRITAVLTAALTLAAASLPTNAQAQGYYGYVLHTSVRVATVAALGAAALTAVAVGTMPVGRLRLLLSSLRSAASAAVLLLRLWRRRLWRLWWRRLWWRRLWRLWWRRYGGW